MDILESLNISFLESLNTSLSLLLNHSKVAGGLAMTLHSIMRICCSAVLLLIFTCISLAETTNNDLPWITV